MKRAVISIIAAILISFSPQPSSAKLPLETYQHYFARQVYEFCQTKSDKCKTKHYWPYEIPSEFKDWVLKYNHWGSPCKAERILFAEFNKYDINFLATTPHCIIKTRRKGKGGVLFSWDT